MIYGTKQAATYLGITVSGLRYHIDAGNIVPEKIGKTLVFTQEQLDQFIKTRRPAGRPKGDPNVSHL